MLSSSPPEPADRAAPQRVGILGIDVSVVDLDRATSVIEGWIRSRTANYVCITGAHGVIESRSDSRLRAVHNAAGMVTPDGMPLVFMAKRLGYSEIGRVYGPDLMRRLTALSATKGYRQFYYGGGPGLADRLSAALRRRFPRLVVAGTLTPPFRQLTDAEDDAIVAKINAAAPDIVWVGLSTPKQEFWMASHVDRIPGAVLIGVGAAFDFLAGTKSQAPLWMQHAGLEWLYRLASEPRRLWRRYARIVPMFIGLALLQLLRERFSRKSVHTGSARKANAN